MYDPTPALTFTPASTPGMSDWNSADAIATDGGGDAGSLSGSIGLDRDKEDEELLALFSGGVITAANAPQLFRRVSLPAAHLNPLSSDENEKAAVATAAPMHTQLKQELGELCNSQFVTEELCGPTNQGEIFPGQPVVIYGVVNKTEMNGTLGTVVRFLENSEQCAVQVPGREKLIQIKAMYLRPRGKSEALKSFIDHTTATCCGRDDDDTVTLVDVLTWGPDGAVVTGKEEELWINSDAEERKASLRSSLESTFETNLCWKLAASYANGPDGSWRLGTGLDSMTSSESFLQDLKHAFQEKFETTPAQAVQQDGGSGDGEAADDDDDDELDGELSSTMRAALLGQAQCQCLACKHQVTITQETILQLTMGALLGSSLTPTCPYCSVCTLPSSLPPFLPSSLPSFLPTNLSSNHRPP